MKKRFIFSFCQLISPIKIDEKCLNFGKIRIYIELKISKVIKYTIINKNSKVPIDPTSVKKFI